MAKREHWVWGLLLLAGVVALGFALLGSRGVPEVNRLRGEREHLEMEIQELEQRRDALSREVVRLQDDTRDPMAIERRAREDLGMVRKGETVIMLPEKADDGR